MCVISLWVYCLINGKKVAIKLIIIIKKKRNEYIDSTTRNWNRFDCYCVHLKGTSFYFSFVSSTTIDPPPPPDIFYVAATIHNNVTGFAFYKRRIRIRLWFSSLWSDPSVFHPTPPLLLHREKQVVPSLQTLLLSFPPNGPLTAVKSETVGDGSKPTAGTTGASWL